MIFSTFHLVFHCSVCRLDVSDVVLIRVFRRSQPCPLLLHSYQGYYSALSFSFAESRSHRA